MDPALEATIKSIKAYLISAEGVNILKYPGNRIDFVNNLVNMGVESCMIKFALKLENDLIDLDLLFYIVDIIKTRDNCIIFYSPESRVLDLKIIMRKEA
jgi:hypothetical protein